MSKYNIPNVKTFEYTKIIGIENIDFGKYVIIDDFVLIYAKEKISIGDYVHIASFSTVKGIDISQYRACQLNTLLIRKADLILVMESFHKTAIETKETSAKGKIFRLGEWDGIDIPDPYKQDVKVFESTLQLIEQSIIKWARKL